LLSFPGFVHGIYWSGLIQRYIEPLFPDSLVLNYVAYALTYFNPLRLLTAVQESGFLEKLTLMYEELESSGQTVVFLQTPAAGYFMDTKKEEFTTRVSALNTLEGNVSYYRDANTTLEATIGARVPEELFLTQEEDPFMPPEHRHLSILGNQYYGQFVFHYLEEKNLLKK
jgi:hypothetical protein